jgi:hypothetical protein
MKMGLTDPGLSAGTEQFAGLSLSAWGTIFQGIVATATLITAGLAWMGLRTWRKREHFKTARDISSGCISLRRSLTAWRQPAGMPLQMWEEPIRSRNEPTAEMVNHLKEVYERRFDQVKDALTKLQDAVIEADAVWKSNLTSEIDDIARHVNSQRADLTTHYGMAQSREMRRALEESGVTWDSVKSQIWADYGEQDERGDELDRAITAIEEEAEQHLRPLRWNRPLERLRQCLGIGG